VRRETSLPLWQSRSPGYTQTVFGFPDAFKVYKVTAYIELGDFPLQEAQRSMQVLPVIFGFSGGVIVKRSQAAISATIRVEHQQYGLCAMEAHGCPDLFQHKLAVRLIFVASKALSAPCDKNGIEKRYTKALGQFPEHQVKAMVKAPDNRGVTGISFLWRLEMKYLANGAPRPAHSL